MTWWKIVPFYQEPRSRNQCIHHPKKLAVKDWVKIPISQIPNRKSSPKVNIPFLINPTARFSNAIFKRTYNNQQSCHNWQFTPFPTLKIAPHLKVFDFVETLPKLCEVLFDSEQKKEQPSKYFAFKILNHKVLCSWRIFQIHFTRRHSFIELLLIIPSPPKSFSLQTISHLALNFCWPYQRKLDLTLSIFLCTPSWILIGFWFAARTSLAQRPCNLTILVWQFLNANDIIRLADSRVLLHLTN